MPSTIGPRRHRPDFGGSERPIAHRPEDFRRALSLIVLTDRGLAAPRSVLEVVERALRGGATAVQVREKDRGASEILELAQGLRRLTRAYDALLFVNDRFDLALAANADGVHLGPEDLPVAEVRAQVPSDFLIGYSTDLPEEAMRAERDGADYLGVGAVFETPHKADVGVPIGCEGLKAIVDAVTIPVVGIGGISADRLPALAGSGAAGIAVIGAVMAAADPTAASRALLQGAASLPLPH